MADLPHPESAEICHLAEKLPSDTIPTAMDNVTLIRVVSGLMVFVVIVHIVPIPYWRIFSKAGFSGWLSLLMIVPLVNLIILYIVAFSDWKRPA